MREEFIKYLGSIDITKALREKIETIHKFFQEICPDEITGIFITDYMKEDGSREYENIWFFSKKYCMEAKQFITKDDFDITPTKKRVYYWTIQKQDYDFKKATEKSRLHLKFFLDTKIDCEFKSSKGNCDYLREIILKYIAPNLKE
ncbi:MAG: hypothetical protein IIA61_03930 [Candidatus Marinimicrobia bacterium]|nr:hypothetical protein [Candidatus Neomarinimicrobiota bacterium]